MTPATRMGVALRRLGTLTGIIRVRTEDVVRAERDGNLDERMYAIVDQLEAVVAELEAALT